MDDVPGLDFGPCCCCGRAAPDVRVRNVVMLHRRAPVPGTGWGCFRCGLSMDGAVYVACDRCAEGSVPPREVCAGRPTARRRVPVDELPEGTFDHDLSRHPEGATSGGDPP